MEDFGTVVKYSSLISCSDLIVSLLEVCTSLWGGWLILLWYPFYNFISVCPACEGAGYLFHLLVLFSWYVTESTLTNGDPPLENSILK